MAKQQDDVQWFSSQVVDVVKSALDNTNRLKKEFGESSLSSIAKGLLGLTAVPKIAPDLEKEFWDVAGRAKKQAAGLVQFTTGLVLSSKSSFKKDIDGFAKGTLDNFYAVQHFINAVPART